MAGKRSPTAHRTKAQIRKHGRTYQATAEQRKKRSQRNKARRKMEKAGAVSKGDGKDVHHKRGMSNSRKNLTVKSRSANRGHGKGRAGSRKRK